MGLMGPMGELSKMFKQFKITKMYQLTRILTGYRKCCLKILSNPETGCAQRLSKLSGMLDIIRKFCAPRLSKMSECPKCARLTGLFVLVNKNLNQPSQTGAKHPSMAAVQIVQNGWAGCQGFCCIAVRPHPRNPRNPRNPRIPGLRKLPGAVNSAFRSAGSWPRSLSAARCG